MANKIVNVGIAIVDAIGRTSDEVPEPKARETTGLADPAILPGR